MKFKRDLNKYSSNYISTPFEKHQVYYRRKHLLDFLKKHPDKNILEVGCGMESLGFYYKKYNSLDIIEPSTFFYNNLKANNSFKSNFYNCYFENFESEKSYEIIILSSLLHEIENLDLFLEKLVSISDSETLIYINVPNSNSFHRILGVKSKITNSINDQSTLNQRNQTQQIFDLESLTSLVTNKGFNVIESGSYFIKPFTHIQMQKLLDSKIINKQILDGFYEMVDYMPGLGSEIFIIVKLNS